MSSINSSVNQMFAGRSIFITGASGFVGRVLVEKLLRTYPGIKKIYVLMRTKRGIRPHDRLSRSLLRGPIFDKIREADDGLLTKIQVIEGDITEPNLGIGDDTWETLVHDDTLSIIYHVAATVKFQESLKVATQLNLIATKSTIEFAKRLKNLVAFCHVSTAYVNSHIKDNTPIEEKIYPMDMTPEVLIKMSQNYRDDWLDSMTPGLLGGRPNTYTFTKALAEHLIAQHAGELPVAIVRPSIVLGAWKEPIAGWIDNHNGPTGFFAMGLRGLVRSLHVTRDCVADLIPVDICVNTIIAASYYAAKNYGKICGHPTPENKIRGGQNNNSAETILGPEYPIIFHCASSDLNPITMVGVEHMQFALTQKYPSEKVVRYSCGSFKNNKLIDLITRIFQHFLPALILDLMFMIAGRRPIFISMYRKLQVAATAVAYFSHNTFKFKTDNFRLLQECLVDEIDKKDLRLNIIDLDWNEYSETFILGIRRFLLKEDDKTIESSRRSANRAYYVEMAMSLLALILSFLLIRYLALLN